MKSKNKHHRNTKGNDPAGDTHFGLVYQEVEDVIDKMGLSDVYLLQEPVEITDPETGDVRITNAGMSYSELIAPIILAIQQLSAENQELRKQNMCLYNLMKNHGIKMEL